MKIRIQETASQPDRSLCRFRSATSGVAADRMPSTQNARCRRFEIDCDPPSAWWLVYDMLAHASFVCACRQQCVPARSQKHTTARLCQAGCRAEGHGDLAVRRAGGPERQAADRRHPQGREEAVLRRGGVHGARQDDADRQGRPHRRSRQRGHHRAGLLQRRPVQRGQGRRTASRRSRSPSTRARRRGSSPRRCPP